MLTRRGFLKLSTGTVVATATMAEAGALAEFLDWLRRKPKWSIPAKPLSTMAFLDGATFRVMALKQAYPTLLVANLLESGPIGGLGAQINCPVFVNKTVTANITPALASNLEVGDIVSISDLRSLPLPTQNARDLNSEMERAMQRAWKRERRRA